MGCDGGTVWPLFFLGSVSLIVGLMFLIFNVDLVAAWIFMSVSGSLFFFAILALLMCPKKDKPKKNTTPVAVSSTPTYIYVPTPTTTPTTAPKTTPKTTPTTTPAPIVNPVRIPRDLPGLALLDIKTIEDFRSVAEQIELSPFEEVEKIYVDCVHDECPYVAIIKKNNKRKESGTLELIFARDNMYHVDGAPEDSKNWSGS
eukprot:TRINITY_DN3452_c0_g1_i3.p1 TRINITY_DN3452_c0_g1~~TRINITY_DN3452_c0_g1_i3.p1  ORF type:complete len:201 (+),score=41.48 TRINITY_DN3452_c0_g1_i3:276-878(+)